MQLQKARHNEIFKKYLHLDSYKGQDFIIWLALLHFRDLLKIRDYCILLVLVTNPYTHH